LEILVDQPGDAPGPAACKAAVLSLDTPGPYEIWHAALVLPQARWVLGTLLHKLVRGVLDSSIAEKRWRQVASRARPLGSIHDRRGLGLIEFGFESVFGSDGGAGRAEDRIIRPVGRRPGSPDQWGDRGPPLLLEIDEKNEHRCLTLW
jgi:hypothetical protein